jgi:hypothetical protein
MNRWLKGCLALLTAAALFWGPRSATPAAAQTTITANNDQAQLAFPDRITFSATLESSGAEITEVILEYGTSQLTCGEVIAKAYPETTAGTSVPVEWVWEMRLSGSLPPGAQVWWQWRVTTADEAVATTPRQTITWLDDVHNWQTVSGSMINLYWYYGDRDFANALLAAAEQALTRLEQDIGLKPEQPVSLYIYANYDDMREAILYEPGWTGGMAFAEHNIVIIGIEPGNLAWGKRTEGHELTHVLVGHYVFSCLGGLPTWLSEGLAVYGEGGLTADEQANFDQAIADDTLASVRALNGGFSEELDKADLSYSQSYHLVKYLLDTYGRAQMLRLLETLRDGTAIEEAIQQVYDLDLDSFEDAWRAAIGAQPRRAAEATATPLPTEVPTIVPVSGIPAVAAAQPTATRPPAQPTKTLAPKPTNTPVPTNTLAPTPTSSGWQVASIAGAFAGVACLFLVVIILIIVLGSRRRHPRQREVQQ